MEEVEEVPAMLGRLGQRDNVEGLKERLVMLMVQPYTSTLAKRWSARILALAASFCYVA